MLLCDLASASTFTVTSTDDTPDYDVTDGACLDINGVCTLRAAIMQANHDLGSDSISFSFTGGGVHSIDVSTPLPLITDQLGIQGPGPNQVEITTSHGVAVGIDFGAGSDSSSLTFVTINGFQTAVHVAAARNVFVYNNNIGTDPTGMLARPNTTTGILIDGQAQATLEVNLVSGNPVGVTVVDGAATDAGDSIGRNANNSGYLPNGTGILLDGASFSVGYPYPTVAGNTGDGIHIKGAGSNVNISANTSIFANGGAGIAVEASARSNFFSGASIHDNGGLGIDLLDANGNYGVTPNDPGDADAGANDLQNFPTGKTGFPAPRLCNNGTLVDGGLDSLPNTQFKISLYQSPQCDPSGYGEGQQYVSSQTITTDATGHKDFVFNLPTAIMGGWVVTLLADGPGGTSEFSECAALQATCPPVPPSTTTSTTTTQTATTMTATTTSTTTTTAGPTTTTMPGATTTTTTATTTTSTTVTSTTTSTTRTTTTSTTVPVCGNGIVEAGEACDFGANNGLGNCCDATTCQLTAPDIICRAHSGPCDTDAVCSGTTDACPENLPKPSNAICRQAEGPCDQAEFCDGAHPSCPANVFKPSTTECGPPPAGPCELQAHCTGASAQCPAKQLTTDVCRPSVGECDVEESCLGDGPYCPPDQFAPAGTACGGTPDTCQEASACSGFSPQCPSGPAKADGTECGDGSCDTPGQCTGGQCKTPCAGDAAVAGGAGKVTVVCTLSDVNGDQQASCSAEGYSTGGVTPMDTTPDVNGCVPGCPAVANAHVTRRKSVAFDAGRVLRDINKRSDTATENVSTNTNGKNYLANHPDISMGVCVKVRDHFGHVLRKQCPAVLAKPIRKRRG